LRDRLTQFSRKGHRQHRPIFDLIPLEQRLFLSFAAEISGNPVIDDDGNYTLNLSASGSEAPGITGWYIEWGDGATSSPGAQDTISHPYTAAPPNPIKAKATYTTNTGGSRTTDFVSLGLDRTFDGDGKATQMDPVAGNDLGYATAIQADGRIVVAGVVNGNDFGLARFNVDGSLDASFGNGGFVATNFTTNSTDIAYAVAIQTDGKIVAAGSTGNSFAVARYKTDGTLDATFDGDGKVSTTFPDPASSSTTGSSSSAYSLVIQPDRKIVAAGQLTGSDFSSRFAIARYGTNGALDTMFDGDGKAYVDFASCSSDSTAASAYGVTLQADGKVVLAGYATVSSGTGGTSTYDFALARLNTSHSRAVRSAEWQRQLQCIRYAVSVEGIPGRIVLRSRRGQRQPDRQVRRPVLDRSQRARRLPGLAGDGGRVRLRQGGRGFLRAHRGKHRLRRQRHGWVVEQRVHQYVGLPAGRIVRTSQRDGRRSMACSDTPSRDL
jgi:uncharacterized delta-60 repeat protein